MRNAYDTLVGTVTSKGTLTGTIAGKGRLHGTIAARGTLTGAIAARGTLRATMRPCGALTASLRSHGQLIGALTIAPGAKPSPGEPSEPGGYPLDAEFVLVLADGTHVRTMTVDAP